MRVSSCFALFLAFSCSWQAFAGFPEDPPNDPDWDSAEEAFPDGDFFDQSWKHFSQHTLYAPDLSYPGARTDLAWRESTGRWDVPVAVLDSGCYWDSRDLLEKYWLNAGELPVPEVSGRAGLALPADGGAAGLGDAVPPRGDFREGLPTYEELDARMEEMGVELEGELAWWMSGEGPLAEGWASGPYACLQAYRERWAAAPKVVPVEREARPVPAGLDLGEYDVNGDGRFNVRDYDGDERVSDVNGNGLIDPQDLILIFSDDVDDDGNGYVDDICGWDFWERDNDAYDDTRFGHGNGGAHDAVAEGDNGMGGIGSCPDCPLVPLRVADSFIADGADVALALAYCADNGVRAMDSSLGVITNAPTAKAALDYCAEKGVALAASFADENSLHHNFISVYDPAIATAPIGANNVNVEAVLPFVTFKAKNNCSNYGARLDYVTPAQYCSSEATATSAGHIGLLQSYAEDLVAAGELESSITVDEAKQLLTQSAERINMPPLPWRHPSGPGWDQNYGYGRLNMEAAFAMLREGRIPPSANIVTPDWFVTYDPDASDEVVIQGRVEARRAAGFRYELEWGWGVYPSRWHTLEKTGMLLQPVEGRLGALDLGKLKRSRYTGVAKKPNDFALSIRLRVFDEMGRRGEDRVQIFVHHDPDLLPGFPVELGASGESAPLVFDLDGDGLDEVILGSASGAVHAFRADGSELPGFPVETGLIADCDPGNPGNHLAAQAFVQGKVEPIRAGVFGPVAVADLDGDGGNELVVADLDGYVRVWNAAGELLPGWPVRTDPEFSRVRTAEQIVDDGIGAAPVLADLDGDGDREVLVAAMDGHLYAWHHDGSVVNGFPFAVWDESEAVPTPSRIMATPAVGDLDGDGAVEIVVGTNEVYKNVGRLYALEVDGTVLPGWPVRPLGFYADVLRMIGRGLPGSPVLADVTGDGMLEVVAESMLGRSYVYDRWGNELSATRMEVPGAFPESFDLPTLTHLNHPAVADVDGDGDLDIATGGVGLRWALSQGLAGIYLPYDCHLNVHDLRSGRFLSRFPQLIEDHTFQGTPTIADLDGDGRVEVLQGSGGYLVHAIDARGNEPEGWPKGTGNWVFGSVSVGDVDGDGLMDVAAVTREGWLWVWRTAGPVRPGGAPWPTFHQEVPIGSAWCRRWMAGGLLPMAKGARSLRLAAGG